MDQQERMEKENKTLSTERCENIDTLQAYINIMNRLLKQPTTLYPDPVADRYSIICAYENFASKTQRQAVTGENLPAFILQGNYVQLCQKLAGKLLGSKLLHLILVQLARGTYIFKIFNQTASFPSFLSIFACEIVCKEYLT